MYDNSKTQKLGGKMALVRKLETNFSGYTEMELQNNPFFFQSRKESRVESNYTNLPHLGLLGYLDLDERIKRWLVALAC